MFELGKTPNVDKKSFVLVVNEFWDCVEVVLYCWLCDALNPGSVDYPSTRGIQVDVGLPNATSENRAESPLYGELYQNTTPA